MARKSNACSHGGTRDAATRIALGERGTCTDRRIGGITCSIAAKRWWMGAARRFSERCVCNGRDLVRSPCRGGNAYVRPSLPARGLFLVNSQHEDGSWYVRSRSVKFQPYFESGFPYGNDQWISTAGTS